MVIALLTLLAYAALIAAACAFVAWLSAVRRRVLRQRAWHERQAIAPWWS
jgi:hypothetical protein